MYNFFILVCAQIVLESFPISSSGHIVLLENFLKLFSSYVIVGISGNRLVSYFLHGPTLVVLAVFFWDRWMFLLNNFLLLWRIIVKIICLVFVADLVTFLWYIVFNYWINISSFPIGLGFLISIACLFSLRFFSRDTYSVITFPKAILIGFCQGFALLPGVSRFGLTFVVGRWVGLSAKKSFEFSFAIQWPLILAGFAKSLLSISYVDINIFNIYTLLVILIFSIFAFFALNLVYVMALENKLWMFSILLFFSFWAWVSLLFLR